MTSNAYFRGVRLCLKGNQESTHLSVPRSLRPSEEAMVLSVDEFLDRIGSFGRYQVRLVGMLCYMYCFNFAIQVMLLTFVAAEPAWHCVANSTVCTLAGEFRPGDDNYDFRCGGNVTRADWTFSDSFTSIVTEVTCRPQRGPGRCL